VSSVSILDAGSVIRNIAARLLGGAFYQMPEPEVLTHHRVSLGTSGDPVIILGVACVLRAVRLWNGGPEPCHVKFHDTAGTPIAGTTPVVYTASAQAGFGNPDPCVAGGGRAFSAGLAMTIVTGESDSDSTSVAAGKVIVDVEYHLA
jgi:hypothetical protein